MKPWVLIALIFSGTFPVWAQVEGSIRGVVMNERGIPVKGATVYPSNNRPVAGRVFPAALTDETGHFALQGLPLDEYEVKAYNEEEDYPELDGVWLSFYKRPSWPKVNLTAREPLAAVEVRLGPKTAVLLGTITDAITGAALGACAGFSPVSQPDTTTAYPVNTKYRLLIPADANVAVQVWLDGYKPWYYPGTDQKSARTSMRLKPGEERNVNVRLQPQKNAHAAMCGIRVLH